jgi:hypothetical protein
LRAWKDHGFRHLEAWVNVDYPDPGISMFHLRLWGDSASRIGRLVKWFMGKQAMVKLKIKGSIKGVQSALKKMLPLKAAQRAK